MRALPYELGFRRSRSRRSVETVYSPCGEPSSPPTPAGLGMIQRNRVGATTVVTMASRMMLPSWALERRPRCRPISATTMIRVPPCRSPDAQQHRSRDQEKPGYAQQTPSGIPFHQRGYDRHSQQRQEVGEQRSQNGSCPLTLEEPDVDLKTSQKHQPEAISNGTPLRRLISTSFMTLRRPRGRGKTTTPTDSEDAKSKGPSRPAPGAAMKVISVCS